MASITPKTGVVSTPSNAEEKRSSDLTRWILRFFASGSLRLKSRGSHNTPNANFKIEKSTISAAKGNISIVFNSNGGTCNIYNSGTPPNGSDSALTVARPKFLDKLPQFSMWDIQTEERLRDNGFCRVYAAKVNGKRALMKEFYGENATKAWVATARLHAATHFAPEFLRLIGASTAHERTEDEEGVEMNPFLLLELADLQPWKQQYSEELKSSDTAENLIRRMYLVDDLMNITCYSIKLALSGIIIPGDVSFYQRSVKRHGLIYFRPTLSLNYSGTGRDTRELVSLRNTMLLNVLGISPARYNDDEVVSSMTSLMILNVSETDVGAAYGLREFMYPNPLVMRYTSGNTRTGTFIACLWTKSCKPRSRIGLLDEMVARGAITPQEREEAIENLYPDDPIELTAASREGSDSDSESDDR